MGPHWIASSTFSIILSFIIFLSLTPLDNLSLKKFSYFLLKFNVAEPEKRVRAVQQKMHFEGKIEPYKILGKTWKNISLKKGKCVYPDDSLLSLMSVCTNMTLMDCRRHIRIKCDIKCDEDGLQKNQWNTGLVWIPAPKQNGAKRHKKVALITFAR